MEKYDTYPLFAYARKTEMVDLSVSQYYEKCVNFVEKHLNSVTAATGGLVKRNPIICGGGSGVLTLE